MSVEDRGVGGASVGGVGAGVGGAGVGVGVGAGVGAGAGVAHGGGLDVGAARIANKFAPTRGHRALRRGRVSVIGARYFITACTEQREPLLESARAAEIIFSELRRIETEAAPIELIASVVMPDHVHAVFTLQAGELDATMKRFRGATAVAINRALDRTGKVWQRGWFEHRLRPGDELAPILNYLWHNPDRPGRHFRCRAEVWAWFKNGIGEPAEYYDWLGLSP